MMKCGLAQGTASIFAATASTVGPMMAAPRSSSSGQVRSRCSGRHRTVRRFRRHLRKSPDQQARKAKTRAEIYLGRDRKYGGRRNVWDFSVGRSFGLMGKTLPFIIFRMIVYFGIALA